MSDMTAEEALELNEQMVQDFVRITVDNFTRTLNGLGITGFNFTSRPGDDDSAVVDFAITSFERSDGEH